jgi:hypothetical protein
MASAVRLRRQECGDEESAGAKKGGTPIFTFTQTHFVVVASVSNG